MRTVIPTLIAFLLAVQAIADEATDVGGTIVAFTYVVKAAPVWTADGTFDPSVLIKLIETATEQKSLRFQQFPESGALSITTTIATHDQIVKLFKRFPALAIAWGPANPDFSKLLREHEQQLACQKKLTSLSERLERDRLDALRKRKSIEGISEPKQSFP